MAPQLVKFHVWELASSSVTRACGVATVGRGRVARISVQLAWPPKYSAWLQVFNSEVFIVANAMACGHKWCSVKVTGVVAAAAQPVGHVKAATNW